jgi:hypothetical protein
VTAMKRVVIAGATGMVGGYAFRHAPDHLAVRAVTASGRKPAALTAPGTDRGAPSQLLGCCALTDALSFRILPGVVADRNRRRHGRGP